MVNKCDRTDLKGKKVDILQLSRERKNNDFAHFPSWFRSVKNLKKEGENVSVTASTGIASLNVNGQTIHSWSGIKDGRFSNQELEDKLNKNENYIQYKQNILSTDCLIIDEISMISKKIFEQIESICRKILKNDKLFGGIQVIVVGDFFQLPPVPDHLKNDAGEYCFKSSTFQQLFKHKFILTEVIRQTQPDFIQAINDIARGELQTETEHLLYRLRRPLPPGPEPIRLCARNFDCYIFNATKLMDLPGDYTVYNSIDEGQISKLDKSPVTKQLHLKIGFPVMLLKNLNEKLVNGLRGIVSSLSSKCVTINFTGPNGQILTANLKAETFLVFSCNENRVIASRQQIPICLAYSITIHKAQGLTLQRVEVDASNMFAPGQLGVAIGRATEKKGLRVIGFNRSSVLKHEASLYQFYDASNNNEFDNSGKLTCCKIVFNNTEGNSVDTIENSNLDDELSDFSDGEIEEIDFLLSKDTDITEPCEPDQIQELFIDLTEISALFSDLNTAPIDKTCGNISEKSVEPKVWTKYYTEVYQYSVSSEYAGLAKSLFQNEPSSLDFQLCSKIFDKVTSAVLKKHADTITSQEKCISSSNEMSDSGKGKLRNGKKRFSIQTDQSFNLYGAGILNYTHGELLKNKPLFELWKNLFCDFEIVDSIFMVCSQDSEQCLIELYTDVVLSFCRISDNEFRKGILRQFGKTKTERLRKKVDSKVSTSGTLTMKNIYGDNSQGKVSSHLKLKSLVFDSSKSAFSNFVQNDLLKLCHAYAIPIASNSTNDKIKDKLCSVLSSALEIPFPEYLNESGPTKSPPTDQTLDSTQTIVQSVPDVSDVQVPSTSGQSEVTIKAKPKLKRKRTRSKLVTKTKKRKNNNENSGENDTICPLCQRIYVDGDEWIACDICDVWYDRQCLSLSDSQWSEIEGDDWYCPKCKK
ncbi:PIF1 [Mytilus coruscus]|uniref:ATP-dependent DNA helicase n=1 Tax=Mytilus coruscus TaxID=42192 RepID=A0A6J8E924_MYTCO|nr:PIF1 [Mytilus coruscus]